MRDLAVDLWEQVVAAGRTDRDSAPDVVDGPVIGAAWTGYDATHSAGDRGAASAARPPSPPEHSMTIPAATTTS